ncbi:MAG TPA: type IV pili twitching motility protein PilT [Candidatus Pacebacteria bacterium]|nr:type IV pili twitching motility protein PilT [Candidatus Paceibacterota bacterium]
MTIYDLLQQLVDQKGSDIHLLVGSPPMFRVDGELRAVADLPALDEAAAEALILPLLNQDQQQVFRSNKELDFGYQFNDQGRFRVNVYLALGKMAAALRLIPPTIKTIEELGLPPILHEFTHFNQGLVLLTGPTGEGKSTTLAALIDEINAGRNEHILTIEDPVEFVHQPKKSIVSHREVGQDTKEWTAALKSALREDPNVVLVGEMRDYETIAATLTLAETGHLVFATLHTGSASQTIDRIIDVFPSAQQGQIRQQLSATLKVVAAQRLIAKAGGGRVAAFEIMVVNDAIRNLIRESKVFQIDNVLQTSGEAGMVLIENYLLDLLNQGVITRETALATAFRPKELQRLLGLT